MERATEDETPEPSAVPIAPEAEAKGSPSPRTSPRHGVEVRGEPSPRGLVGLGLGFARRVSAARRPTYAPPSTAPPSTRFFRRMEEQEGEAWEVVDDEVDDDNLEALKGTFDTAYGLSKVSRLVLFEGLFIVCC